MKLARVNIDGVATLVMPMDGQWINVSQAYHDYQQVIDFIDGQVMHSIEEVMRRGLFTPGFFHQLGNFVRKPGMLQEYLLPENLTFLQPLHPGKVISVGRNYRAFLEQQKLPIPEEPVFYAKSASVCIGPGAPIVLRRRYGRVDHEGEIAVVIGQPAQDVPEEEAYDYIAGYTIINDITARDLQQRDMEQGHPWYRAKNLATFCPVGPVVVHRDALSWPPEAAIEVRVNGDVRQKGNTREFLFSIPHLIAAITHFIPLEPGDIVSTGTPEGVSPLEPGDDVEIFVEGIGVLKNPVVASGD